MKIFGGSEREEFWRGSRCEILLLDVGGRRAFGIAPEALSGKTVQKPYNVTRSRFEPKISETRYSRDNGAFIQFGHPAKQVENTTRYLEAHRCFHETSACSYRQTLHWKRQERMSLHFDKGFRDRG